MKSAENTAETVFLRAFDGAIEQVYQQLALSGLNDASIWSAFRRATSVLAKMSGELENEVGPSVTQRAGNQGRRSVTGK